MASKGLARLLTQPQLDPPYRLTINTIPLLLPSTCTHKQMLLAARSPVAAVPRTACGARPQRVPASKPAFGHAAVVPSRSRSQAVVCRGLFGLGLPELAVIAGVAALIFGPSKLPELGKGLGKTVKSFQDAASEFNQELKAGMEADKKADAAKTDDTGAAPKQ